MTTSPELTDKDAINLMLEYYSQRSPAQYIARLVARLSRIDIDVVGLVKYAYEQGMTTHKPILDISHPS